MRSNSISRTRLALVCLTFSLSAVVPNLRATTFLIPDDVKFIAKAHAIVIGTVEGSYVNPDGSDSPIETIYEIRLERVLKGRFAEDDLLNVVSAGGESGRYGVYVAGAASFRQGQRVLLFLTHHKGHWETTDMMLGEFSFMTALHGEHVLVRGHDSVDDRGTGEVHAVDKIRSEDGFIAFIEHSLQGRPEAPDYFVEADEVAAPTTQANAFLRPVTMTYAASSYTQVGGGPGGVRWDTATIAAALNYARHTGCGGCDPTNADTFITTGMAAWNNDCGSTVNLQLTGTTATAALTGVAGCNNFCDFTNVIEFGDPNNHISGSWAGSGTIAITTIIYDTTADSAGTGFRQLLDADIIYQDGYLPNSEASAPQATTHELGHSIGWRHSNADPTTPNAGCGVSCGGTENCNTLTADCAGGGYGGSAIMFWLVGSVGYTLQTWDQNAIRAVYPGGACGTPPSAPTNVVATATSSTSISLTWTASTGTAPINYQVQRSALGTGGFANVGSSTTLTAATDPVSSTSASYLYRVVATNGSGSATSSYDLATNVIFTDLTLTPVVTQIQAAHINELRTAVRAVQTLAGQAPTSFGTASAGTTTILRNDVTGLRSALDLARAALSLPPLSYAEAITATTTTVKASHFNELRAGVQ
ncbi:MAG TPA: hypothetical protein VLV78_16105 [Thermoanaerobaculia bacterium]|nr:hypothetical protein [Thermoanaerobaculia bacterium]